MFKKRLLQYALFWLYTLFALVLPCAMLIEKYGIVTEPSAKKITFCGFFIIILALFYFRKHLGKLIDSMTPCWFKSVLMATREVMPLIIIFVAFYGCYYLLENQIESMLYIIKWTCIFNVIAYFIRIVHLRYADRVKEEYQIGIVKKALK